ncbi:MAG: phenylacetate--CoA ligase, partial [Syntrophobacteraceae bacterium]|nr:phenylacetate--CoA ligase [Syntrophobacteraceae bacterium]
MKTTKVYWDESVEALSRDQLEALQVRRLRETIERASSSVFYAERFKEAGISPSVISSPGDVARL